MRGRSFAPARPASSPFTRKFAGDQVRKQRIPKIRKCTQLHDALLYWIRSARSEFGDSVQTEFHSTSRRLVGAAIGRTPLASLREMQAHADVPVVPLRGSCDHEVPESGSACEVVDEGCVGTPAFFGFKHDRDVKRRSTSVRNSMTSLRQRQTSRPLQAACRHVKCTPRFDRSPGMDHLLDSCKRRTERSDPALESGTISATVERKTSASQAR